MDGTTNALLDPPSSIRLFQVGGCVRDALLGVKSKDIDFAVEAPSFGAMRAFLAERGFTIFVETPEFLTVRARFPKDSGIRDTADFVLCRRDGRSSNSRHPDEVTPGSIFDDLARRDFTVNAMAVDGDGVLLDPHNGQGDLAVRKLVFVGDPAERIQEDSLRVLRAVRFAVTKGFRLDFETRFAIKGREVPRLLDSVSTERIRDELHKAFAVDTIATIRLLDELFLFEPLFMRDGLRLEPTMRGGAR